MKTLNTRGSNHAPPSPEISPSVTKLSANTAERPATLLSHMHVKSQPAPIVGQFTAAITRTSSRSKARGDAGCPFDTWPPWRQAGVRFTLLADHGLQIAASRERCAGACQNDHPDAGIVVQCLKTGQQCVDRVAPVSALRTSG
jgi:hypothetical protein